MLWTIHYAAKLHARGHIDVSEYMPEPQEVRAAVRVSWADFGMLWLVVSRAFGALARLCRKPSQHAA